MARTSGVGDRDARSDRLAAPRSEEDCDSAIGTKPATAWQKTRRLTSGSRKSNPEQDWKVGEVLRKECWRSKG
jgi:hypothetical protein